MIALRYDLVFHGEVFVLLKGFGVDAGHRWITLRIHESATVRFLQSCANLRTLNIVDIILVDGLAHERLIAQVRRQITGSKVALVRPKLLDTYHRA